MTTETENKTLIARPYTGKDRQDALEADIEVLDKGYIIEKKKEEPKDEDPLDAIPDADLQTEEATYKKRYGDLRRHSQSKEAEKSERIAALETELADATRSQSTRPMDDDALTKFSEDNPEAADVFTSFAQREVEKSQDKIDKLESQLSEATIKTSKAEAMSTVKGRHSDYDTIVDDDNFHNWVESKSAHYQQGVYDNATDGEWLADILDSYKAETGFGSVEKAASRKQTKKDAADIVDLKSKSTVLDSDQKPTFTRSQIQAMQGQEWDDNEEAILLARKEGRILEG